MYTVPVVGAKVVLPELDGLLVDGVRVLAVVLCMGVLQYRVMLRNVVIIDTYIEVMTCKLSAKTSINTMESTQMKYITTTSLHYISSTPHTRTFSLL